MVSMVFCIVSMQIMISVVARQLLGVLGGRYVFVDSGQMASIK